MVLQKMSFDKNLFRKELVKAMNWLGAEDVNVLKAWCFATYSDSYADVFDEVFEKVDYQLASADC